MAAMESICLRQSARLDYVGRYLLACVLESPLPTVDSKKDRPPATEAESQMTTLAVAITTTINSIKLNRHHLPSGRALLRAIAEALIKDGCVEQQEAAAEEAEEVVETGEEVLYLALSAVKGKSVKAAAEEAVEEAEEMEEVEEEVQAEEAEEAEAEAVEAAEAAKVAKAAEAAKAEATAEARDSES